MRVLANQSMLMADDFAARLAREAPDAALTWLDRDGNPLGPSADADVLFRFEMSNPALATALRAAPQLRWLHTGSAGVDRFHDLVRREGPPDLIFTNGSGTMTPAIAEYILAQIFAAAKGLHTLALAQRDHTWRRGANRPQGRDVRGSDLLILGLGSIGLEIARLAHAVGMQVSGTRRTPLAPGETLPDVTRILTGDDEWRALLPEMDYVAICLPLTPATHGLIGAAELAAMRDTAWLINTSRGAIIDEPALIAALQAGQIGGAALDVTTTEPLPAESPLWDMPNAVITPHMSWMSPSFAPRSLDLFFANLRRYRAGEPLLNIVPPDVGY